MRRRLLMISYPFPPNATAGAVRSERFARHLGEHGWDIDVLTIKARADLFDDRGRLETLGSPVRVHFTETFDPWLKLQAARPKALALRALRTVGLRLTSFPDHMIFWVGYAVREGLRLARSGGFDAIYTTSPPHSTHLAGWILSRWTCRPWVADFRDPWTLNAYRGKGRLDAALLRIEKVLERGVLKQASAVLANTVANRANLLSAFPFLPKQKVVYLPNGWEPFPEGLPGPAPLGPFTIVHAGAFYPRFKPFGLLKALAIWKSGEHAAEIRPMGPLRVVLLGCRDTEVRRLVEDLRLDDVVEIRPWVAMEEARREMCGADALWTTLGTGPESATYVPSKIYEYIAAGRPIIGFFPPGEAAQLINDTGTGVVFGSDDPAPVLRCLAMALAAKRSGMAPAFWAPVPEQIERRRVDRVARDLESLLDGLSGARADPRS